jgi:hypothetical protein
MDADLRIFIDVATGQEGALCCHQVDDVAVIRRALYFFNRTSENPRVAAFKRLRTVGADNGTSAKAEASPALLSAGGGHQRFAPLREAAGLTWPRATGRWARRTTRGRC